MEHFVSQSRGMANRLECATSSIEYSLGRLSGYVSAADPQPPEPACEAPISVRLDGAFCDIYSSINRLENLAAYFAEITHRQEDKTNLSAAPTPIPGGACPPFMGNTPGYTSKGGM